MLHPISEYMGRGGFDVLNDLRREAIRERESWASLKKVAGRFAKDEERLWLKRYRAVCLIIGHVFGADELGDCKPPERATGADNDKCGHLVWPDDLREEIRWAEGAALARIHRPLANLNAETMAIKTEQTSPSQHQGEKP